MDQLNQGITEALNCTSQAVTAAARFVRAYDDAGLARVPTECRVGDLLQWKRDGSRGAYRCRVLRFKDEADGTLRLRIRVLSHDGREVEPWTTWITDRGVLRVIPDRDPA